VRFYQLTQAEVEAVNALNSGRTDVLLIVCCVEGKTGVDADALRREEYAPYLEAIGGTFQEERAVTLPD